MKVTDYFDNANGNTLISFEVLPPLKGGSMKAIFDTLDPLMEFKHLSLMLLITERNLFMSKKQRAIVKKQPFANDLGQ